MSWFDSHLLSLLIFLPLVGAVVVALLPRAEGGQHKAVAFVTSLVVFGLSIPLWTGFPPGAGAKTQWAFEQKAAWAPTLGFSYHVGIDGVALLLILLTTILGPIVVLSSWNSVQSRVKEFCIALLILETAMLGTLAALDLVLFYVFWEAMLIPMYLLIGVWGSERRIYAAVKFFLFTFIGSVLMLLAIFYCWSQSGAAGARTFDYTALLQNAQFTAEAQRWLFAAFALAFAIKVPVFPLHTWLPDAHTEAPAAGSVLLAGVMLKMGTFGFIRYAMPLFPSAARDWAPTLAVLGVIGIIYGSLMCMAQTDLKRLIAYSSVAHLGFVMLGLSALTAESVNGAVLQMINHGISTGALFLIIGYLYERTHTRDLAAYGGLARVAPAMAAVFLVVVLSSIGLPATNGFVGEFLILIGTFTAQMGAWHPFNFEIQRGVALSVLGATGVILGAVYMLWMYQKVMFGPKRSAATHGLADLGGREWATLVPLLALIVIIGVFPGEFLAPIKTPVDDFIARVQGNGGRRPDQSGQPVRPRALRPSFDIAPDARPKPGVLPGQLLPQRPSIVPQGNGQ